MINKKEISEALALSCVESYFLAWLGKYYDVSNLYGHSFISLKQAFDDFSHGAIYENYYYLPRLQDVAEGYGVVKHEYHSCSIQKALELLKNQGDDNLCLIRVNTGFFTGYKREAWREDHYICVNKNLEWINQYPLSEGAFTEKRFMEVYDGAVCIYKMNNSTLTLLDYATLQYTMQDFDIRELPRGLGALESALGILRVSRKRLERYYNSKPKVKELLRELIVCMDKIYFDVHFRRLKEIKKETSNKEKAYSELYEKIEYIIELERKISEELKDE